MKNLRTKIDQLGQQTNCSRRLVLLATAWLVAGAPIVLAQTSARPSPDARTATPTATAPAAIRAAASDPTLGIAFDVVSIKPSGPQSSNYGVRTLPEGDTLSADNFTVDDIVRWAYHLGHRWGEPEHPDVPKWY